MLLLNNISLELLRTLHMHLALSIKARELVVLVTLFALVLMVLRILHPVKEAVW